MQTPNPRLPHHDVTELVDFVERSDGSMGVEAKKVGACSGAMHHVSNVMMFGRCGCWDEGRNRHPYWGWDGRADT